MKILISWIAIVCAVRADLQTSESQSTPRNVQAPKNANAIPITQKPDHFYQQQLQVQHPQLQHAQLQQPLQQYYPVQYLPAPIFQQHQQQHTQPAMIIIAQPQPISHHAMLTQAAQQLLNFFNANPQARYQFLQGNFQPQLQQQSYVPQQSPVPAYTYQVMAVQPQYQQVHSPQAHPGAQFAASAQPLPTPQQPQHPPQSDAQETYKQLPQFQLPIIGQFGHTTHLPHIATLAQLATQKYIPQIPQIPIRNTGQAIVTGLENFTPEQQAQIKAQLQSGGPITPLRSSLPPNFGSDLQQNSSAVKATGPVAQTTSQQEYPAADESKGAVQQAQAQTSSNYNQAYANQFTKG